MNSAELNDQILAKYGRGDHWLSANQASKIMGMSPAKVRKLVTDGKLDAIRYTTRFSIPRVAIEEYMKGEA